MQLDGNAANSRQRLVILVHGDEEGRLLCRTALSQAGFEVITATDAETALLVARFIAPDVVLLDVAADEQRLLEAVGGGLIPA